MMKLPRLIKNSSGFSMVEVATVTGIVGLMAAVAVPNYCRFVARAKMNEAKSGLAAVFSAEAAFSVNASSFSACVVDLGVKADAQRSYALGFGSWTKAYGTCGANGKGACGVSSWVPGPVPCNATSDGGPSGVAGPSTGFNANVRSSLTNKQNWWPTVDSLAETSDKLPAAYKGRPSVEKARFYAQAAGLVSGCASEADRWLIDENKNLIQWNVGI